MTQPTVPTGPEDALAIARATFQPRWPDGTLAPLHVHEFDIGYLVYASFPPVTDLSRPPEPRDLQAGRRALLRPQPAPGDRHRRLPQALPAGFVEPAKMTNRA
jgi:hypothetical protein